MPIKYTDEMLREAVASSESFASVLRFLNAGRSGSVHGHIKSRVMKLGLDTSHFTHRNSSVESSKKKSASEILIKKQDGERRTTRPQLLRAMIESGLEYQCSDCPLSTSWNGKVLNLEIDHKDGDSTNNVLSNLQFLCPNCHSQTLSNNRSQAFNPFSSDPETLALILGKKETQDNSKYKLCGDGCSNLIKPSSNKCRTCNGKQLKPERQKIVWPSVEDLIAQVQLSSYVQVGKALGVSDNSVRKRITYYGYSTKTFSKLK